MKLEEYLLSTGFTKTDIGFTAKRQMQSNVVINGMPTPGKEITINLISLGEGAIDDTVIRGYTVEVDGEAQIDVWDSRDDELFFLGIL